MSERREKRRVKGYRPVNIHGIDNPNAAISVDYSGSGLGILTTLNLTPGDSFMISCLDFWPKPRNAEVVWFEPVIDTNSRAGLMLH